MNELSTILVWCAVAAVLMVFTYTLGMFLESAGVRTPRPGWDGGDWTVVFLVPCLNEERVIAATLQRLLSYPGSLVLVIDDGSDDRTSEIVRGFAVPRVRLLRRDLPNARQGKGEALNHGIHHLRSEGLLRDRPADRVVICLMDADGRLDPHALEETLPHFTDPAVGAAQIGVRIGNRGHSLLARLQDMEFVLYTHVFQRTRGRLGAAGLGGNGQFVRLSTLLALGDRPWSASLTEDLDLGVRVILDDRRIRSLPHVAVSQQGLERLGPLVRQRSRWFQGHLQAWRLIPSVVKRSTGRVTADLLHVLLSPLLIFVGSFMTVSLAALLTGAAFAAEVRQQLFQPLPIVSWYALTFSPAYLLGPLYARATREMGPLRAVALGHLFVCYGLIWLCAGWWALLRTLTGRQNWLKTERIAEQPVRARS
jgi:1,2-diacylglycerol 3-beta-glucosyltransferase